VSNSGDITEQIKSNYDATAYESRAHRQTRPDRLAVEAAFRGIRAPSVERCRVLDIGCASGGNLIPMAEQLPEAKFLGIDLSNLQVQAGMEAIRQLELTNIELRCQDLMKFSKDEGPFDYIIAHGFYAWVPQPVRQRLLEVCRDHLTPQGMAFISYNVLPGSRSLALARDMMQFHARHTDDPIQKASRGREIVRFMTERTPDTRVYRDTLRLLQKELAEESDSQLYHDQLAPVHDPQYFWAFMEHAKSNGLGYAGDVGVYQNPWFVLAPTVRDLLRKLSADPIEQEQYLDFLINRPFRCSVLCHANALPEKETTAMQRLQALHVAGNPVETPMGKNAEGLTIFEFSIKQIKVHVSNPRSLAILRHIRKAWPATISFAELQAWAVKQSPELPASQTAGEDMARLIELYGQMGLIELWARSNHTIAATVSEFPRATRYARWQAIHDNVVTSLRHEPVFLDEAFRQLLPLLDGTRDKKTLAAELTRLKETELGGNWASKSQEHLEQMIEATLKFMASSSLFLSEKKGA
jgi:methyltransferase-like protein/2-polyprenyl-3-methyl-5-hydroxy-6-metoxy-1,4-benzoquinol methylase